MRIPNITLGDLSPELMGRFEHGVLYEFLPYRQDPGGEILFECEKEGPKTFFEERFRIYRGEDIRGIERREDPTYVDGLCQSLYIRTPGSSSILDMGCGSAKYLIPLNQTDREILAFDLSKEIIQENKAWKELDRISFFAGNALEQDFIPPQSFDYISAVNLLNVLGPENVLKILAEGSRIAKKGILLGFTLPSQSDLWTTMTPELNQVVTEGIGNASAPEEIQEVAARQSFLGQMNMFRFLRETCEKKGWAARVFRFLDKTSVERSDFPDSGMLYPEENAVLKFLEFPFRKISAVEELPKNKVHVHALGYGMEIAFTEKESLPPLPSLCYFQDKEDFQSRSIESEMNHMIDFWNLPFQKYTI